jgi:hypothetical protein
VANPTATHSFIKWALGPVGTAVFGAIWWGMKKFIDSLKTEWGNVTSRLARIEQVQGVQTENHLKTIETNTAKTNEILEKMELQSAELTGFLKGILNKNS